MAPAQVKLVMVVAIAAALAGGACGSSTPSGNDGGKGGTGGQGGAGGGIADGGIAGADGGGQGDTADDAADDAADDSSSNGDAPEAGPSPSDGGVDAGDARLLSGCVDKVSGSNTTPVIVNLPDRLCDTYGSFTLTASAAGAAAATNLTLFRTDATGLNLMASSDHFARGVWTTQIGAQNVPGNYVVHLFIATVPDPGPGDFIALAGPLSLPLSAGDNTFYFFADGDDQAGGDYGFGLNVWLGNAAAGRPTLSGFTAVPGGTLMVDGTTGCSPAYDGTCAVSAKTLATMTAPTVTLKSFIVGGVGGGAVPADAGAAD